MKERPILFSAPMVRAILEGRKTQTRRVVKISHRTPGLAACLEPQQGLPVRPKVAAELCPHGQPGDRLWVKEAFRFPESIDHLSPADIGTKALDVGYPKPWCPTQFEADGRRRTLQEWRDFVTPGLPNEAGRLRQAMHMPRWASRILLEITAVRVERLQDINAADAKSEGIEGQFEDGPWRNYQRDGHWFPEGKDTAPVMSYRTLWEHIHGPGSWDANPWAWVVEFKRIEEKP